MSAFMCEPQTFAQIAWYVYPDVVTKTNLFQDDANVMDVFFALRDMNAESLAERYGEEIANDMASGNLEEFRAPVERWFDVAILTGLDCYLYQCSEGEIPNKELFKYLESVRNTLALKIARNHPDYGNNWG